MKTGDYYYRFCEWEEETDSFEDDELELELAVHKGDGICFLATLEIILGVFSFGND